MTIKLPEQPQNALQRPKLSLSWLFLVAAFAATLFTAWTEPGMLPGELSATVSTAFDFSSTPEPQWPTATPRARLLVVIVAGHSGNDSGAVCPPELDNTREVDVNLNVAERVRANLINLGVDAELLTEFDDRLKDYRANALVSIHADSCEYINPQATGFKVAPALSNLYPEQSQRLTNCLRARYGEVTKMLFHSGSITRDMTEYHAFGEISKLTPAVIIEVGFLNLDYKILKEQPDLLAQGVTQGILCFLKNEPVVAEK